MSQYCLPESDLECLRLLKSKLIEKNKTLQVRLWLEDNAFILQDAKSGKKGVAKVENKT